MPSPKLDRKVIGGTGLLAPSGFIQNDFLSQLVGQRGVRIWREMSDNDPVIGGILYAIQMMLRGVEWHVEPAQDGGTKADDAAEFVHQCLFEDMSHPFNDFLSDTLSFLPYGHSLFEIVYKIRDGESSDPTKNSKFDDGRVGIRKLAPRPQDTIWRWFLEDDGGLKGVEQLLYGRSNVVIPVEKLLLFRTTANRGNPEGRSLLRNCYISYVRKQAIENAEGRGAMRSAGVVKMTIPGEYMAPDADPTQMAIFQTYKAIADKMAQDRLGSIVLPSERDEKGNAFFDVGYVSTDNRRPADMTAIVERIDKRMAASLLADFILLGQQAVGSFALSSDKTQMFGQSLQGYLNLIGDVLQRVLLPRLWRLNAFDDEVMPTLKPGDVQKESLTELGAFIQQLSAAGMPLFPDEDLEDRLRETAHLPPPSEELRQRAEVQAEAGATMAQAGAQAALNPPEEGKPAQVGPGAKPKLLKPGATQQAVKKLIRRVSSRR